LFLEDVEKCANEFRNLVEGRKVKLISHHDADGITSAAIIAKALLRCGVDFEMKIVKQLTSNLIQNLKVEDEVLMFTDLGSGQLDRLADIARKTDVVVLDHHEIVNFKETGNILHLNPRMYGMYFSASILTYVFSKFLDPKNVDCVDLAIVGAVGDEQDEKWEMKGFAREILEEGVRIGKISLQKGLRLYGRYSRPLHKALEYSFDPFIPSISGSESNAVQLLAELGIPIRTEEGWRRLKDLTEEEERKLATAIIVERLKLSLENAHDIFGEIYTIIERPERIRDAREFATLLNACGRLGFPDIGIRLCLGDYSVMTTAENLMEEYRRRIGEYLEMIREENYLRKGENAYFLMMKDRVPDTMIGTLTSIVTSSNILEEKKPVFGMVYTEENKIKISARVPPNINLNLRDILCKVVEKIGGEAGGHERAAGALIDKSMEEDFVYIIDSKIGELLAKERKG